MKITHFKFLLVVLVIAVGLGVVTPAWGANRDIIELQTQMQTLLDQMSKMQQSLDERMGVMKNLMDQNTDSMNKMVASINALQTNLEKQQNDSGSHVDQLSGQIQTLNDSLDELKARLGKVSKQLEDMQAAQQTLSSQGAASQPSPGVPARSAAPGQAAAPPPDVLYANALRDYNGAKNDIAVQEFSDYVKYYPNTDLAGNAYFYLAEVQYRQGDFASAAKNYDMVLQTFPDGNKASAAELKKGLSLIELGQKEDGVAELRRVVQRYPKSNEALQARERLRKLGVSSATTTHRSTTGR